MGNHDLVHKRSVLRFHDGLAWLMQIVMFLSLGLLVFPSQLVPVMGVGLLVALFLTLVARPISVWVSLARTRFSAAEKSMVAWVGLRGAVPIILATFPLLAGVPQADLMFNIVFFVVLLSVLAQGTTLPVVARWLQVDVPSSPHARTPHTFVPTVSVLSRVEQIVVPPDSPVVNRSLIDASLPAGALIALLHRGDDTIVPNGGTVLAAGDRLLVVADQEVLAHVQAYIAPDTPSSLEPTPPQAPSVPLPSDEQR